MSDFDKMKRIAARNGKIGSAPLANMISLTRNKHGYVIEMGLSHEWGDRIMRDEAVGALYVIDKAEFNAEATT